MIDAFRARFGHPPEAIIHAPGRVNLIGDHIDYLGLPVLPMAIQYGIRLALAPRPDHLVRIVNTDERFAPAEFEARTGITPGAPGAWDNYVRAGVLSALREVGDVPGFDALVDSTLPLAAGLSSSSALVVAAGLAGAFAARADLDRLRFADALAQGERFVGTEGGGMDQAVCLCALAGHALRIDFEPLRVEPIPFPADWRVLVIPSLRASEKSAGARAAYNDRARAAHAALQSIVPGLRGPALLQLLREDPERFDAAARHSPRLRHVLSEGTRVLHAVAALRHADVSAFGALMTESHESLRDDYEVSTPELDRIVAVALEAGASGARLTGAGFGGCAIALGTAAQVDAVRAALQEQFYTPSARDPMFVAQPSVGARVLPR